MKAIISICIIGIIAALLFALSSCKKETNTVELILSNGAGDVVITEGDLVTDFGGCNEGWSLEREAKIDTRYTIWTNAKYSHVIIKYNGKKVSEGEKFTAYKTP